MSLSRNARTVAGRVEILFSKVGTLASGVQYNTALCIQHGQPHGDGAVSGLLGGWRGWDGGPRLPNLPRKRHSRPGHPNQPAGLTCVCDGATLPVVQYKSYSIIIIVLSGSPHSAGEQQTPTTCYQEYFVRPRPEIFSFLQDVWKLWCSRSRLALRGSPPTARLAISSPCPFPGEDLEKYCTRTVHRLHTSSHGRENKYASATAPLTRIISLFTSSVYLGAHSDATPEICSSQTQTHGELRAHQVLPKYLRYGQVLKSLEYVCTSIGTGTTAPQRPRPHPRQRRPCSRRSRPLGPWMHAGPVRGASTPTTHHSYQATITRRSLSLEASLLSASLLLLLSLLDISFLFWRYTSHPVKSQELPSQPLPAAR